MEFTPLDLRTWNRREHFQHYLREAPCGYSLTRPLDVTERMERAKAGGRRFYPAILWAVATVCNRHAECRMALRDGAPGTYDQVVPVYTVFHEETETFSTIWTEYGRGPGPLCGALPRGCPGLRRNLGFAAKPDCPENAVNVSMPAVVGLHVLPAEPCAGGVPAAHLHLRPRAAGRRPHPPARKRPGAPRGHGWVPRLPRSG